MGGHGNWSCWLYLTGEVSETTARASHGHDGEKFIGRVAQRCSSYSLVHMGIEVIFARSKDKASRRLIIMRKVENDPSDEAGAAGAVLHTLCVSRGRKE